MSSFHVSLNCCIRVRPSLLALTQHPNEPLDISFPRHVHLSSPRLPEGRLIYLCFGFTIHFDYLAPSASHFDIDVIHERWRRYRCQSHLRIFAPAANENGPGTHTRLALLIWNMLSQTRINMRSNEERAKRSEHRSLKRNTSTGHETIKAEWKAIVGEEEGAGEGRLSGLIGYYP